MADIRMVRSEVQKWTEGSSRTCQPYNALQTGHPPCLRQSHYSSMLCLCTCCRFFSSCLVKMVSSRLKFVISCKCFCFHTFPFCTPPSARIPSVRMRFAFSVSPCFSPHLCCVSLSLCLSLDYREFKECGLGARRPSQTRSALCGVLTKAVWRGPLRSPRGTERRRAQRRQENRSKETGFGKH